MSAEEPADRGLMAARVRSYDWATTPVGASETWPPSLHMAVNTVLSSALPTFLAWGPALTSFYNDACVSIMADKPEGLGAPFPDVWAEVWDILGPIAARVMKSAVSCSDDASLTLRGGDARGETSFFFSCSPVRGEEGNVGGLLWTLAETTLRVQNEAALRNARPAPGDHRSGGDTLENSERGSFIAAVDVTEREGIGQSPRADDARQAFLLALSDRLHILRDHRQMMSLTAEMLGAHLDADRVGYSELAPDKMLTVSYVWSRADLPSITGQRRLEELGAALEQDLRAGRMTRLDDALADANTKGNDRADWGRAVINAPLADNGVLAALLFVHQAEPRHWRDAEVELIREVAHRSWASIQRARAEAALRRSEERFRQLTNLIPAFVWYIDPVGAVTFANEQWYTYTGITDEPAERWPELVFHPSERSAARTAWLRHLEAGVPFDIEARIRRKDGSYRWFMTRAVPVHGVDGRITGWFSAATDIHGRKLAEERFREFAAHSTNVLWVVNTQDRALEYLSPAFETVFGRPRDSFLPDSSRLFEVVHPDDRPQILNAFDKAASGEVALEEFRVIRPDGAVRWIRSTLFPIRDEQGEIQRLGGIAADITMYEGRFVYLVHGDKASRESLSRLLKAAGYDAMTFPTSKAFLDAAPALTAGCVVVDLHQPDGLTVPRELKARGIGLPVIALGEPESDVMFGVQAMKAGAMDFLAVPYEPAQLLSAIASASAGIRIYKAHNKHADRARAMITELSGREREVLHGLLAGQTNKEMGRALGISPRTVEAHRAHLMQHLGAKTVSEVVRIAALADLHAD